MSVSTEKLLALKAFYMGHAIAEKHIIKPTALAMINAAIARYQNSRETTEKVRLAFYFILRAEILRHEDTPIDDRREAQRICHEIGSSLYEYFMAIENATQSTKRLDGIQTLSVVDEGIKRTESYWATDGWVSWVVRYDIATRALGISERDITVKQRQFLERATLKDMLDKHGVKYAP
jgi:hypothetical protein